MAFIHISDDFGYVLVTAVLAIFVVNGWMSILVGQARKKYGVKYPAMYADKATNKDADAFNCVQRGHQNTLENLPAFLSLLLIVGLRFPVYAAFAGLTWVAGRIAYFKGYATGDPKARMRGGFNHFGQLALLGLAVAWAVELLKAKFA